MDASSSRLLAPLTGRHQTARPAAARGECGCAAWLGEHACLTPAAHGDIECGSVETFETGVRWEVVGDAPAMPGLPGRKVLAGFSGDRYQALTKVGASMLTELLTAPMQQRVKRDANSPRI